MVKKRMKKKDRLLEEYLLSVQESAPSRAIPKKSNKVLRVFRVIMFLLSFCKRRYQVFLLIALLSTLIQAGLLVFGLQIAEELIDIASDETTVPGGVADCLVMIPFNCTTPEPVCIFDVTLLQLVGAGSPRPKCETNLISILEKLQLHPTNKTSTAFKEYCSCMISSTSASGTTLQDIKNVCEHDKKKEYVSSLATVACTRPAEILRGDQEQSIFNLFKILMYLVAADSVLSFLFSFFARHCGAHLTKRIRSWTFKNILGMDLGGMDGRTHVDIVYTIAEVGIVEELIQILCDTVRNLGIVLVGVGAILFTSNAMLGWEFAVAVVLMFLFSFIFYKFHTKLQHKVMDEESDLQALALSTLSQIRGIRHLRMETQRQTDFNVISIKLHGIVIKMTVLAGIYFSLLSILGTSVYAITIYRAAYYVLDAAISRGRLLVLFLYIDVVFEAVDEIFDEAETFGTLMVCVEEVVDLLLVATSSSSSEHGNKNTSNTTTTNDDNSNNNNDDAQSCVMELQSTHSQTAAFEMFDVSYGAQRLPTDLIDESLFLQKVNMRIEVGSRAMVVVPCGVEEFPNLATAVRKPNAGCVQLSGRNVMDYEAESLRRIVGWVSATDVIFQGTIRDNIALSKTLVDKSVEQVCRECGVHSLILQYEQGYDTIIGEQGSITPSLRRLLSIARCMYQCPELVFIDSSIIMSNQSGSSQCARAIAELIRNKTAVFLTGAVILDYVGCMDTIFLFDDRGYLVAQGKHEQLYENNIAYKNSVNTQEMARAECQYLFAKK